MLSLCKKMQEMIQFTQGCTEPAAIALNAAYVGRYLKNAQKIELSIDKMTFKNAYRAGIPNSEDNIGVTFSLLFGYLMAKTEKELEIFDDLTKDIIEKAKLMKDIVSIDIADTEDMFIHTQAKDKEGNIASATTMGSHTYITEVKLNEDIIISNNPNNNETVVFDDELYIPSKWSRLVEDMYNNKELKSKMNNAIETNLKAASFGFKYNKINGIFGAVYSRMKGDKIRVASCAGSGNKGLTALIAPFEYAQSNKITDKEKIMKAELLSCFVTSLITSKLGFVSPICGVVHAASVGAMAAILYLQGRLDLFDIAFSNYIAAVSGVICDGAKKSCAMKASGAIDIVYQSIEFAKNSITMDYKDGLLGKTFYDTIKNIELYKSAFNMCDMKTINILKGKE